MSNKRPYVLTIAGFDPSGGAGIIADTKTFEGCRVNGLAVTTAITFQNETEFVGVDWLSFDQIDKQLEILFKKYEIGYAKIGLVQDLAHLIAIIEKLLTLNSTIKIIWDSILKSSTDFDFHISFDKTELIKCLNKIYLITPNFEEIKLLSDNANSHEGAKMLSEFCAVLLKGGHNEHDKGRDYLYFNSKVVNFRPKKNCDFPKHGSGCVLSAAITAYLAKGFPLQKACLISKKYITEFLNSNPTLLGYHKF